MAGHDRRQHPGAACADLLAITLGAGTPLSAVQFSVAVALLLYLQRRSRPKRLHAFWLTTTLLRADAISLGDLLVKGRDVHLGLALSTVLTGVLAVALVTF